MPHPRAKVRTQMPLPWDVVDKQMPPGWPGRGWARLDLTHALKIELIEFNSQITCPMLSEIKYKIFHMQNI